MKLRFSLRTVSLVLTACALAAGAVYFLQHRKLANLFGGRDGLAILTRASAVRACRLGDPPGGELTDVGPSPLDYPIVAGPVDVPNDLAKATTKALQSATSYGWDYAKACGPPIYGARLSFARDDEVLDVYLCFKCNVLAICRDGRIVGGEDFDNARPMLVRTIKACFPDDPVIQTLPENL